VFETADNAKRGVDHTEVAKDRLGAIRRGIPKEDGAARRDNPHLHAPAAPYQRRGRGVSGSYRPDIQAADRLRGSDACCRSAKASSNHPGRR